uniref:Putative secreted protein n=1 Tax=Ixodes ricinus TaxID=34613 RepID=A0A6B0U891_IXORI
MKSLFKTFTLYCFAATEVASHHASLAVVLCCDLGSSAEKPLETTPCSTTKSTLSISSKKNKYTETHH